MTHVQPAYALTACDRNWHKSLSRCARLRLLRRYDVWLRPEQHIPTHRWITCGFSGGRGFGKTMAIARWINARVRAGLESRVALMAPTEQRVDEVQISALIEYADPDFVPVRVTRKGMTGLRWPNGVEAVGFTPTGTSARGSNYSLAWCTEIVDWAPGPRWEAFRNLDIATRKREGRIIWDSTAKGRNEVRTHLEELHEADPKLHVIVPGTMFDNQGLTSEYLRKQWISVTGVRREEELMGASYRESAGALWKQAYFDRSRVAVAPELEWLLVTVDPATTAHYTADETGITRGGRSRDGHAYLLDDASGTHHFEEWGDIAVKLAHPSQRGAGKIGIESKRIGESAFGNLKSRAENAKLRARLIGKDDPWPPWDPTCIFVREYSPQESKGSRAEGPAAETDAGRVHLVDPEYPSAPRFADLEKECTTYVPGVTKRSPNRFDAFAYLVTELRELKLSSPADHARDAATAARMNQELARRLRSGGGSNAIVGAYAGGVFRRGRRMGL